MTRNLGETSVKERPTTLPRLLSLIRKFLQKKVILLSKKTRELIAIGVAASTQCPHCVEAHSRGAAQADATEEELSEAIMVAMALRAGGAMTHGWMAMKYFNDENSDKGEDS